MKYKSYAVSAQRHTSKNGPDFFPSPPWCVRAFMEAAIANHIITNPKKQYCLEPACGMGHMQRALNEYFLSVDGFDKFDYGQGTPPVDFLTGKFKKYDWCITNPPFFLAKEFVEKGLTIADNVAILGRTVFIEGQKRYNEMYKDNPPAFFMPYVERVPMIKDRLDRKATTATSYSWFVCTKEATDGTKVIWIPPSRKRLEKDEDYI